MAVTDHDRGGIHLNLALGDGAFTVWGRLRPRTLVVGNSHEKNKADKKIEKSSGRTGDPHYRAPASPTTRVSRVVRRLGAALTRL